MNQIIRLIENYRRFVQVDWPSNLAGKQRIWFAVYPPSEERRIRARIQEFEIATREAGHSWYLLDITDIDARWLGSHPYKETYFREPSALLGDEEGFRRFVITALRDFLGKPEVGPNTVVALLGAGSLFGLTHISAVISEIEDSIPGRLLVFFPGEYERNLYRFMDARDGFNYMAVPITCRETIPI